MAQDAGCDDFVKDECDCEVPVNRASSAETKDFLNAVKEIGDCAECTRSSCSHYSRAYCRSSSSGGGVGRCQGVGLTTL
jgi:hypothetical protein